MKKPIKKAAAAPKKGGKAKMKTPGRAIDGTMGLEILLPRLGKKRGSC